jgi:hypothetical protein
MESKFQILEQAQPTRCEICHQADQFDPFTASCLRCQAMILTHTLPEDEAERYRRRQEASLTVPRDTSVPVSDLFRVIPEAFKLYRRNLWLFYLIIVAVSLPATLIGLVPVVLPEMIKDNPLLIIVVSLFSILFSLILYPIGMGALTKAILDRYRGEPASFVNSYSFIFERGWRYAATTVLGNLYMTLGFMFCLVGGVYTFPRSVFIPEVSIVEEKYFGKAFSRASYLGTINSGMVLVFGLLWVGAAFAVSIIPTSLALIGGIIAGVLKLTSLILPLTIITQILGALAGMVLTPLFFTTKLLLYFHLRMRTDEVKFTNEVSKKSELQPPIIEAN